MPVWFAINSSSAFGRQFRARWACDTDWDLLSPFWRARFSPCHYGFVKKTMFKLVYIKWNLRDGDPNEYRNFLDFFLKNLVIVVVGLCVRSKSVLVQSETELNWSWNYKAICYQQHVCCLYLNLLWYRDDVGIYGWNVNWEGAGANTNSCISHFHAIAAPQFCVMHRPSMTTVHLKKMCKMFLYSFRSPSLKFHFMYMIFYKSPCFQGLSTSGSNVTWSVCRWHVSSFMSKTTIHIYITITKIFYVQQRFWKSIVHKYTFFTLL
jgi:hypothetical protein